MIEKTVNSLYVHIPFCQKICHYCDFCKVYYTTEDADLYLIQLQKQVDLLPNRPLKTIYIGGGTPTCLSVKQLKQLFNMLTKFVDHNTIEYCIEVNPEFMTKEKIDLFVLYNLNRISIGVQTFNNHLLKAIGRNHQKEDVDILVTMLKQVGITNISFDMMYGLPGQTNEDIINDLSYITTFDIKHVSYYSLILEEHTVFSKKGIEQIDEQIEYEFNKLIKDKLLLLGFKQYEISNYSKENFESKHNLAYWQYNNYYGVGCGAVGKVGKKMFTTLKNVYGYCRGEMNIVEDIRSDDDLMFEHIMMSFRLKEGLDLLDFNKRYGVDFLIKFKSQLLLHKDVLVLERDHIYCTDLGLDCLHQILIDFL